MAVDPLMPMVPSDLELERAPSEYNPRGTNVGIYSRPARSFSPRGQHLNQLSDAEISDGIEEYKVILGEDAEGNLNTPSVDYLYQRGKELIERGYDVSGWIKGIGGAADIPD